MSASTVMNYANKKKKVSSPAKVRKLPIDVITSRYKTKGCDKYAATGVCPYETRCYFAHGDAELRTKEQNLADGLTTEEAVKGHMRKTKMDAAAIAASVAFKNHSQHMAQKESSGNSPAGAKKAPPQHTNSYHHPCCPTSHATSAPVSEVVVATNTLPLVNFFVPATPPSTCLLTALDVPISAQSSVTYVLVPSNDLLGGHLPLSASYLDSSLGSIPLEASHSATSMNASIGGGGATFGSSTSTIFQPNCGTGGYSSSPHPYHHEETPLGLPLDVKGCNSNSQSSTAYQVLATQSSAASPSLKHAFVPSMRRIASLRQEARCTLHCLGGCPDTATTHHYDDHGLDYAVLVGFGAGEVNNTHTATADSYRPSTTAATVTAPRVHQPYAKWE